MIGLRAQCDTDGCGRHFEANAGIDLNPRAQTGPRGDRYVVFAVPFVMLPAGWTTVQVDGHALQLRCADHAQTEDGTP